MLLLFLLLLSSCKTIKSECHCIYDKRLNEKIYTTYDVMPEYPNGIGGLTDLVLSDFIIEEPYNLQTNVVILIVINDKGIPLDVRIRDKKTSDYSLLERKIIEKLQLMQNWIPAQCKNVNVSSYFIYPLNINYKI